jgi:GT2 family glycosyltransferase
MSETDKEDTSVDLSIIIVNWNSREYTKKCLASIYAYMEGISYEVVVIDAGSFDGCGEMLQENFPRVRFIQSNQNLGFARANNVAFKASRGRDVLFLNPDTEIVSPAIKTMQACLHALPQAGAVGCKLLNADGTVQTSCILSLPTILNQLLDSEFLRACWPKSSLWGASALFGNQRDPQEVEAISGACVMLKREAFEKAGLFSEDYFMYAEDVDLGCKVSQAGFRNYFVPDVTVVHFGGGSSSVAASNFSTIMMRESIWQFLRKNRGWTHGCLYRASMLASAIVRLVFLAILFPVEQVRRRGPAWNASFLKWQAVLRWCLNRKRLVRQYDSNRA